MDEKQVKIQADSIKLDGILTIPKGAKGLVIFAHGSGSSRLSPRNRFVASVLEKAGMGTLLFDLLTAKEDEVYANRFDIPLLTERLKSATKWTGERPETAKLKIGYFGASTGTAVALVAAADFGEQIRRSYQEAEGRTLQKMLSAKSSLRRYSSWEEKTA